MKINIILFAIILHFTSNCFAHGEDQLGPNGGYIRMPGAYHTELVIDNSNSIRIYLLDINWKNPTTKKSSVQIKINDDKNLIQCKSIKNYFSCQPPQKISIDQKFKLTVISKRDNQSGSDAAYEFPISLKQEKSSNEHMNHH